jgi:hypothetical protein
MWSEADLASLDAISKGLRNVLIEPRHESDLWLRGSATLDSPLKEWDFQGSTSVAGSSDRVAEHTSGAHIPQLLYPLRIKFDVALANQPECEQSSLCRDCLILILMVHLSCPSSPHIQPLDDFTASCLRHHYKTWKALAQDNVLSSNEAIALHEAPEGLWAITIDHSEEPLPAWWDRQVRRRIRTLEEIREDVRSSPPAVVTEHSPAKPGPLDITSNPRPDNSSQRNASLASHRPRRSQDAVLSTGAQRAAYDDDFEERVISAGERQWLAAVDVLIQMAKWVAVSYWISRI